MGEPFVADELRELPLFSVGEWILFLVTYPLLVDSLCLMSSNGGLRFNGYVQFKYNIYVELKIFNFNILVCKSN